MDTHYRPTSAFEPNPLTQRKHRQEVLWQISIPLAAGMLLVLAAGAGVIFASAAGGAVDRWASISLIWLIIPTMILTLLLIVVTAALAYGLIRLIGVLPGYSRRLQDIFVMINARLRKIADAAVEPALRVHSFTASLRALRRK